MTVATSKHRELIWREEPRVDMAALERMSSIIDRWVGTPYMEGQQCEQAGVDCVRFVEAVLQELYRYSCRARDPILNVAQDASVHDARTTTRVTRDLVRRYPHTIERGCYVHPGDIIICRVGKGPGHTVIIGAKPWSCYHAMPTAGVALGGVGSIPDVQRVIHMLEKNTWA